MSEIKVSAKLVSRHELAFERFRERITQIEQARGVKYTQAKGVRDARETNESFTMNFGGQARLLPINP